MRHTSSLYVMVAAFGVTTQACTMRAQPPAADSPEIDAAAITALNRMGTYLRSLNAFQIRADVTTEEVLENGQKVQIANRLDGVVAKPNRLRLELASDRKQRLFVYDGKQFTIFSPRQKFYSTVAAPSSISALLTMLEDKYGIEMPFVDLFRWGTPEGNVSQIKAAKDIGPSQVDGVTCEQFAFRQDGLDWQVWIQNGEFPLPRKLVITTLTDEARPQYSALYTWNLAPSFNDEAFAFTAPADAKKITIAEVAAKRAATTNGGTGK